MTPHVVKRVALFSVGFIVVLVAGSWMAGVRLNTTGSLPMGLYIRSATGPLVEFCLQDDAARLSLQREYRGAGNCPNGGQPLLKPIAAQGGDTVEVNAGGISVNGRYLRNSAAMTHDRVRSPIAALPLRCISRERWRCVGYLLVYRSKLGLAVLRTRATRGDTRARA